MLIMKKLKYITSALVFVFVSVATFIVLFWIYIRFLDWYVQLGEVKLVVAFCMIGSVAWLMGHGINVYLLELAGRYRLKARTSCWIIGFVLSCVAVAIFVHWVQQLNFKDHKSTFAWLLSGILMSETTFYPLFKLKKCSGADPT